MIPIFLFLITLCDFDKKKYCLFLETKKDNVFFCSLDFGYLSSYISKQDLKKVYTGIDMLFFIIKYNNILNFTIDLEQYKIIIDFADFQTTLYFTELP